MNKTLSIHGIGLTTDSFATLHDFSQQFPTRPAWATLLSRLATLDPALVASHDAITQLALRAAHQAWTTAQLHQTPAERIALIFQTSWGMSDSTIAYLESMLADAGKFASPRHFSRSVYSSAASLVAIHFGIHGPCETLAFERELLTGPLHQAWRLLAANRCDRVMILWAEETNKIAADLAKRAAEQLRRKEFRRYTTNTLGHGAVAIIVGREAIETPSLNLANISPLESNNPDPQSTNPFAMDCSLLLAKYLLSGDWP